ncbi:MAG: hypothetical protein JW820_14580 [Spirochaetales bacterium]|nr:hypothetical protein [Spirochaetales bacterium]
MKRLCVTLWLALAAAGAVQADYFTEAVALGLAAEPLGVERLTVASVSMLSGEENEVCRLYRERLTADLRQRTRYVIVDREDLDALLAEIELSQSELSSEGLQLEVGRMLGAQALVILVIAELAEGTEMFVRVTEVETARILYARSFRDFAQEPAPAGGEYDPRQDLTREDYAPDEASPAAAAAAPSTPAAPPSVPPVVLRPDDAQRSQRIGSPYRASLAQERQELEINNRLYQLKDENPELYRALTEARRGLRRIAGDREMFLLFVFHSPRLSERLRERHPVLARRLAPRFQRLRSQNPGKDAFVRGYLRRYGRLVLADRLLAELVRQRFDRFVREQ